ncbi:MAG: hypothetical protein KC636_35535 [Myxococcales bacterium]|nr:hypothetical protein [Myxococcales bacterium]
MRPNVRLLPALVAAALACGPEPSATESSDATEPSGTESDTAGSSTGSSEATADASTEDTSAGTTDPTETDPDPSETTEGALCDPPTQVLANFSVIPGNESVSADCVVEAADGPPLTLDLRCGADLFQVSFTVSDPELPAAPEVGAAVRLEYIVETIFWDNLWLALKAEGGQTLLGGVSSGAFDPPGKTLGEFFGAPAVVEAAGLCEPAAADCSAVERVAIDVPVLEDSFIRVFDGDVGYADVLAFGYVVWVATAVHNLPPYQCTDLPGAWYQFVFSWFPSD